MFSGYLWTKGFVFSFPWVIRRPLQEIIKCISCGSDCFSCMDNLRGMFLSGFQFLSLLVFAYYISWTNDKYSKKDNNLFYLKLLCSLSKIPMVQFIMDMLCLVLQIYFKATDPFNERWQSAWIITAFWVILSFAILCVICYLWAPSQSSQRCVLFL